MKPHMHVYLYIHIYVWMYICVPVRSCPDRERCQAKLMQTQGQQVLPLTHSPSLSHVSFSLTPLCFLDLVCVPDLLMSRWPLLPRFSTQVGIPGANVAILWDAILVNDCLACGPDYLSVILRLQFFVLSWILYFIPPPPIYLACHYRYNFIFNVSGIIILIVVFWLFFNIFRCISEVYSYLELIIVICSSRR